MTLKAVNSAGLLDKNKYNNNNKNHKHNPSFGYAPIVGLANFIETQGFMGEFLTNDLFGMMGPRVVQGYGRNREELGHLNYKAGREEAVRELLSGPAYFYVPTGIIAATSFILGQCAKVNKAAVDAFEPLMQNIASGYKDKDLKSKFIDNLTSKLFNGFKNETNEIDNINQTMKKVADGELSLGKAKKIVSESLTNLNKANGLHIDDTRKVVLENKEFKINNLLEDVKNYLNDFTKKAAKTTKNENEFIKKFHFNAKMHRNLANILGIASLSAFLVIIPKLYKTGDAFPGKEGLPGAEAAPAADKKEEEVKNANK